MPDGALTGYRVLDLTHYISGPYLTRLMAGMGAEVIKVEKPGEGDGIRKRGPFAGDIAHSERSLPFLYFNQGKKSITLNLKSQTGIEVFKKLLKQADILVENFAPRVMPSLGLEYETLASINPKVVVTSISNFGQTGPYRDYKATEIVEYALSGLMDITGDPDREPLKMGLNAAQTVAGQNAMVPTLAAVYESMFSGQGQHIDISIMEYCAGLLEFQLPMYIHGKYIHKRAGRANEKGHPWGAFPCRNGWVAIAAHENRFKFLADMMGVPELKDPRFANASDRIRLRDEIDAYMLPWLLDHDKEEIFHMIGGNIPGTGAGMVLNTKEILECAPLKQFKFFKELDHPVAGKGLYPSGPVTFTETPWQAKRAPLLGEHNAEVFGSLGYSKQDIVQLKEVGAI